jgi:lipoprotein-releasing system ATP-binding protein
LEDADYLKELMCQLNRELGTAFVVVTHDRELAGKLHRQVHMVDGALVGGE